MHSTTPATQPTSGMLLSVHAHAHTHGAWRYYLKALGIGLVLVIFAWVVESIMHLHFFQETSWQQSLFPTEANERWMRIAMSSLLIAGTLVFAKMIRQRLQLSEQLQLTQLALEVMREGCLITNHANEIIYVNPRYEAISGYKASEVLGKNPNVLSSGKQDKSFYETLWNSLQSKGFWEGEIWNRKKNGELYPEWITITLVTDKKGAPLYHVAVFSDITLQKEASDKIKHYAYYDPLTDCVNRRFFMERLVQTIRLSKRQNQSFALLYLDLDHFKPINDEHGHAVGDDYLQHVAKAIKSPLRDIDTIARFGGDEFVVLLPNIENLQNAAELADRLITQLRHTSIEIEDHHFKISASIGGAIFPDNGVDAETLLEAADAAMYHIKDGQKDGVHFVSKSDRQAPPTP